MSQNVSSLQGEQKTITNDPHTQALSNCSISIKKYTEAKEKLETARKELQRLNNTTKNDKERKEQKKREIDYLEKEYKESKRKAEEDYGAIENKFLSFDEFVESVNNTIKEFEAEISHSAGSSNISKGKKTAEKIKETGIAHGIKKDKRGNPFKK